MENVEQLKDFTSLSNQEKLSLIKTVFERERIGKEFYNQKTNMASGVYVGFSDDEIIEMVKKDFSDLFKEDSSLRETDLLFPQSEGHLTVGHVFVDQNRTDFNLLDYDRAIGEEISHGQYFVNTKLLS